MKIAIITSGFFPVVDGVTVTVMQRLQKLSEWGHQVLLLCPDYADLEEIYPNWQQFTGQILPQVTVVNLPSEPFMGVQFERNFTLKANSLLLEKLREFQPDLIHVDEPERISVGILKFAGIDYAKQANVPCTSFFHTNFIEYTEDFLNFPTPLIRGLQAIFKRTIPWTYNAYSKTLVASPTTYRKIKKLGIKNAVLGDFLGVDLARYQPTLKRDDFWQTEYQIPDVANKVKLIFLGRLTPDKGWEFTLAALPKLFQRLNPDRVAILIAGDGALREAIATTLSQVTPHVHFLGRVDPEQVPAILLNSDIHVTTSEKETRGLTILEAFAAGIAVLAPQAEGIVDSIQAGQNGLLFTPRHAQEFVEKLQQLIENGSLRQQLGQQAQQSVAHSSWEQATQNLVDVWQEAIHSIKAASPKL